MKPFAISLLHAAFMVATVVGQPRPYNCDNQPTICSNICYWQICVHPEQTTYTYDSAGDVAGRRTACGVTHDPRPCPPTDASPPGLGIGIAGDEADEFPFASMAEGGRTPFGDGASILCVPAQEQRGNKVQGGAVTQLYRGLNQGAVFELGLQNTDGIPYCDPGATPNPGSCDGIGFGGFHFFPDVDERGIYCQWDIDASASVTCISGVDGSLVDPPTLRFMERDLRKAANWTALLHIRDPERVKELPVETLIALPFEA